MKINLNQLINSMNKLYNCKDNSLIIFELCDNNEIRVSKGEVAYFFNYQKLMEILEINKVDLKNPESVYEVLSKHLSNQLSASIGKKVHPEILSTTTDFI
jgi:hypothetical protein